MPYQALTCEEITSISTHICTTNLPNIQAGTVSSLIQSWNNINRPNITRPRSPGVENPSMTVCERREPLAEKSEFSDTDTVTNSPGIETSVSPSPKAESPISTFPRIESYVSTFSRIHSSKIQSPVSSFSRNHSSKMQSPASTLSKTDSPITTFPKKVAPVPSPPEKESRRVMARERWHGKSWVKRDFVDRKNGGWIRPVDLKGPLAPPVQPVPSEAARTAETPVSADLWSPGIEEDSRAGLRRLSARPPTEQRRPLPESWYRSPQHDDDGRSSANASNTHLEKLKAIGRKHGLDFEPAEDESDCPSTHEQLQHKIHMRNHRRCHRCGEIYDFYNICLRCGHKCCRECPRSPSEKADEDSWITTGSCSANEERKSSSLLPMTHTNSSFTDSASLDGDDGMEDAPPYIDALMEDIDNAITTAGEGYESSQRGSSQGGESECEDSEIIAEVGQRQTMPPGSFPDSANQSTNSLQEKDAQVQNILYEKLATPLVEDFLSPGDRSVTKELAADVEGSQSSLTSSSSSSSSTPPAPQSSRSSCSCGSHSPPTACSERSRGRTSNRAHSHTKQKLRHYHAIPHHRQEPCCHCCCYYVASHCHHYYECPSQTVYRDCSPRPPFCCTHVGRACDRRDEASDWGGCSQATPQHCCRSRRQYCRLLCTCESSHYRDDPSRYYRQQHPRPPSARPFVLALHLTNQYPSSQTPRTPEPTTPTMVVTPQSQSVDPSGHWSVLTISPRKIESVDGGITPASDASQPSFWKEQQSALSKVPNHQQQSKSAPMTRRGSNEIVQTRTRQGSIAATTGQGTPRQTLKQGSVAARARAWEQTAATSFSIPTPPKSQGKAEDQSSRGSGESCPSSRDTKSQKNSDGDSEQARVSLHREFTAPEHGNKIRVIVEIVGDRDGEREGAEEEPMVLRRTAKWVVDFDVDVGVDVEVVRTH
jgi:hypothetical protein